MVDIGKMVQLHLRRGIIHITKGETDGVLPQRNVHGAFRVEDIGETTHLPNMAANVIISKNKAVRKLKLNFSRLKSYDAGDMFVLFMLYTSDC
jgi:hypothetical protein